MMIYDLDYIRSKSVEVPFSGCWIWMGCVSSDGYSQINQKPWSGHKSAYIAANGDVPEGLEIHHKCNVRCCVNPDHLEAVTHLENIRASSLMGSYNRNKTHCKRSHEFTIENTYIENAPTKRGYARKCRTCNQAKNRRRYLKSRQ